MAVERSNPSGLCWCGCGQEVGPGKYFVQAHDRWAGAFVIRQRYGNIAAFLEHHGYGPGGKSARAEARTAQENLPSSARSSEEDEDRLDIAEAERRLADPNDVPIPYEEARRTMGLA
jgi:hypothetical protein